MSTANVIPFPSRSRRARVIVMTPRSTPQVVAPTMSGQLIVLPLRRREPKPPSAWRELRRQVRQVQRWLRER